MKKILLALFVVLLVGCEVEDGQIEVIKMGSYYAKPKIVCIDNVHYFISRESNGHTTLSAKFTKHGEVELCLDEESQIEYEEDLEFHEELSY